jgi:acetoin utilization protein AcuC
MPVHAGDASYLAAFNEIILPVAREFKPQIIIRNGGSDPHFNDGLTYLGMTVSGFKVMGSKVREMAEICDGRQMDLMMSGYNAEVLPYAWLSLLSGVADFPLTMEEPEAVPLSLRTIWSCLRLKQCWKNYARCSALTGSA